ncbi:MAG: indolepyruvate ferredoxin oxidoreductase family protein [Gammaproteobacteria bacterium]|nr:indolepyruvate ferredoxin oxidoreductase family protein [Gammaproteobacteria bacterium]MBU1414002.1 indolepyruvate ferredoxin oxidoreductase family protein [Gammaproteobacteria bacterium]
MNAPLRSISLDDKYTIASGRIYLTGIQALARLPMLQRGRDLAAGLNTAGFISGYRGSPLGGLDQTLWKAREQLAAHHIRFQPGVNEDLAATAIWGTQQVNLFPGAKYDGVFAMWYGKGPGVDRSGDVFKHANSAGTSQFGGVLVVAGDDHAARSSTVAHQSEHAFKTVMMPVLAPSGVQEYLDLGLHGWALSRYSGCWVGFKAVADTIESSASVDISPDRVRIVIPDDYELPPDGLNIRWPDPPLVQEARLLNHKLYAALAYCRANQLNRVVIDSPDAKLGIITCGKSYLDVRQAFDDLGIDDALAAEIGIRLYKVGMVWPLEADGVRRFAEGLDEILVVEEKRQFIEYQLKEELYNWREDVRPRVIGKFDEKGEWSLPHGKWLLPATSELSPAQIARVIAERIDRVFTSTRIKERLELIEARERALASPVIAIQRTPTFCPGCPHNTSTKVPEGSLALAGIGCHYMVTWMDRNTATFSHMGGEGAAWIGQAPFTERQHMFVNLGDGTYFHSGLLAIRAAVAANVNITYKLLYNDAVAMTGGQPLDGTLTVPQLAAQIRAEGVQRIVVVTDGSERAYAKRDLPEGIEMRHRNELDAIQRELREVPGVTALIYDQTCAAEKRRRRKRGKVPDPAVRVFINERVCEGCGDCGVQSNCMAIVPRETEYGRKRAIDQSACNKDYACLDGLCPAFVTIEGGALKKGRAMRSDESSFVPPPEPPLPDTGEPWNILITGVGGSGVITIGALIGMAAHIDGKGVSVLDMTGLAQKGGAVFSHVRIADSPDDLHAVRIATGEADAVIAGDIIVAASREALIKMTGKRTRAVVNSCETPTAEFTHDPDWQFPLAKMQEAIRTATGESAATFIDATALATHLLGDAIATNLFLLGLAWQQGLVPVTGAALERAIELNGTAVEMNRKAFLWGRRAALNRAGVEQYAMPHRRESPAPRTVEELIDARAADLTAYRNAAYARRYRERVDRWRPATADNAPAGAGNASLRSQTGWTPEGRHFSELVARNYYKLLAIKDEYEVARLYNDPAFEDEVADLFEGGYEVRYHLAPPILSRVDPATGRPGKHVFGPWLRGAFRGLARLKFLRGTIFDPFGKTEERRAERQLIADYEADLDLALANDSPEKVDAVRALLSWPEQVRGYGVVKMKNIEVARKQRDAARSALLQ